MQIEKDTGVLEVSNLTFGYRRNLLFKDLSFSLQKGQLLHIKGSNGVGKSTLLALVANLLDPQSGKIILNADFDYLNSETNGFYLKRSAIENLTFWLNLAREPINTEEIRAELASWGMSNPLITEQLPVQKFSTGMKRKLALARMRLKKSELWLLDEPLLGLDQKGAEQFESVLCQHLGQNGSALIVSHEVLKSKNRIEYYRELQL